MASRSQHLELGSKWLPSKYTRVDAAWFRIKTDNEIVTDLTVSGKSAYTNAPQTLREGIELATKHQFSDHWRGQASATTMRAIYQNWSTKSGNALPGIPNKQIFSSIAWSQKGFQPSGIKQVPGAEVSLDWVGRSVMWANDTNDTASAASGYSIFNARLRQRIEVGPSQLEAYLGINNLTDQKTIGSVIINQSSSQYFEPGLPRNWVVGVISKIYLK